MDSSSCDQLPSITSLKSLVCDLKYPNGNFLIHQFVLSNSEQRKPCSESDIRAALRSFPVAQANSRDDRGFTPLHLAVMKRNSFMVKMLLSCFTTIDVNAECARQKITSLHLAADDDYFGCGTEHEDVKECLEIVNVLLASGAYIDLKNTSGETPLYVAVKKNKIDLIKVLISNGAALNKLGPLLHHAIIEGRFEAVQVLVEGGVDVEAKSGCSYGFYPIHLAVKEDRRDIVKYLISKNVDLDTQDYRRMTPLHFAVTSGKLETVRDLVKGGALLNLKDIWDQTPLHVAARKNSVDITRFLIDSGADVNAIDSAGRTPLHEAVSETFFNRYGQATKNCFETVEALVKGGGGDVEAMNHKREAALSIAASRNYLDIVNLITARLDSLDQTSLSEAASSKSSVCEPPLKKNVPDGQTRKT